MTFVNTIKVRNTGVIKAEIHIEAVCSFLEFYKTDNQALLDLRTLLKEISVLHYKH